jgi:hypothetical protein
MFRMVGQPEAIQKRAWRKSIEISSKPTSGPGQLPVSPSSDHNHQGAGHQLARQGRIRCGALTSHRNTERRSPGNRRNLLARAPLSSNSLPELCGSVKSMQGGPMTGRLQARPSMNSANVEKSSLQRSQCDPRLEPCRTRSPGPTARLPVFMCTRRLYSPFW